MKKLYYALAVLVMAITIAGPGPGHAAGPCWQVFTSGSSYGRGLAADTNSLFWFTSPGIQEYSLTTGTSVNSGAVILSDAQGMAVDSNGDVWGADHNGAKVVKFSGATLAKVQEITQATTSSGTASMALPWGVAWNDQTNKLIVSFRAGHLLELDTATAVADTHYAPWGSNLRYIDFSNENGTDYIYAVDGLGDSVITKYTYPDFTEVGSYQSNLQYPDGLAVSGGKMYLSDGSIPMSGPGTRA